MFYCLSETRTVSQNSRRNAREKRTTQRKFSRCAGIFSHRAPAKRTALPLRDSKSCTKWQLAKILLSVATVISWTGPHAQPERKAANVRVCRPNNSAEVSVPLSAAPAPEHQTSESGRDQHHRRWLRYRHLRELLIDERDTGRRSVICTHE